MNMLLVKYVHIVAVAATFALFFVRGLWVLRAYPSPQEGWVLYLPHVIDAILVASALAVLWDTRNLGWPGTWMTVKLALVAVYAVLAFAVLRFARGFGVRIVTWIAALALFLFVTTVAVLHHPLGIFSVL
ncbi:MAG: SirB2 family protein [Betaproteobacteria bacterium]|nr:SirB2 family protein [Betaproteobacteria bacterium]